MNLTVAYRGKSSIVPGAGGLAISLSPNLRRDRVSFDGALRQPLRFREAMSALHDVVVSDLRYQPRDRSAYEAYIAEQKRRENALRTATAKQTRAAIVAAMPELPEPFSPDLERRYIRLRKQYWAARIKYSDYLLQHDPELWRMLVPCDPVITVAPDVLFFECFSADQSSYGCLTVNREAFSSEREVALGTTNVDYSWALYEHFQTLRSYRETRFHVDPAGFEAATEDAGAHHEEKIELPPSWLRGFMQMQAAMSLPLRRVPLSCEGLYGVLAFLKRHRAKRSPRAIRFELEPGRPVSVVLEPWEARIACPGTRYDGTRSETIRVWGRDRLRVLARLLPLLDEAEVYLLGTGLPSFWSIRMGEMRLLLGLSGWTANDWTGPSALDQLAPPAEPDADILLKVGAAFRDHPTLTLEHVLARSRTSAPLAAAGLNRLAQMGQVIHDLHAGVYRWRQIMPVAVSLDLIGPDDPETEAARAIVLENRVQVSRNEKRPDGLQVLEGRAGERPVALLLDADGRMLRGKCTCSHHFKSGLRRGPCRHLQALRTITLRGTKAASLDAWYKSLLN